MLGKDAAATPPSTKQKTHTSPEEEGEEVIHGGINDATDRPQFEQYRYFELIRPRKDGL